LRQIKSKIRAMEMLKKSKLPKNLELQHKKNRIKRMNNMLQSKEVNDDYKRHHEHHHVAKYHDVPNYDELYRKFMTEFEFKKAQKKKNTTVKPFVLRSASRTRNVPIENKKKPSISRSMSMLSLSKRV
jgi:hypothetical protein